MPRESLDPEQPDPLDRDLEDMSGSPALARGLKEDLRRLRDGAAGPELAEMARDVLDGNIELRTAARSSFYADQLTEAVGRYQSWKEQRTSDELDQFRYETQRYLDQEAQPGR